MSNPEFPRAVRMKEDGYCFIDPYDPDYMKERLAKDCKFWVSKETGCVYVELWNERRPINITLRQMYRTRPVYVSQYRYAHEHIEKFPELLEASRRAQELLSQWDAIVRAYRLPAEQLDPFLVKYHWVWEGHSQRVRLDPRSRKLPKLSDEARQALNAVLDELYFVLHMMESQMFWIDHYFREAKA